MKTQNENFDPDKARQVLRVIIAVLTALLGALGTGVAAAHFIA